MTQYDIKFGEPRDQKAGRKSEASRKRKFDWERAMREAAEAEQLIRSAD